MCFYSHLIQSFIGILGRKEPSYVYQSLLLTLVLGFASDFCNDKDTLLLHNYNLKPNSCCHTSIFVSFAMLIFKTEAFHLLVMYSWLLGNAVLPCRSITLWKCTYNSTTIYPKLMEIVFTRFLYAAYKGLPSINNIYTCTSFSSLFHFYHRPLCGLAGAYVNPRSFSLFVHSLVCPITHSFLDRFQLY